MTWSIKRENGHCILIRDGEQHGQILVHQTAAIICSLLNAVERAGMGIVSAPDTEPDDGESEPESDETYYENLSMSGIMDRLLETENTLQKAIVVINSDIRNLRNDLDETKGRATTIEQKARNTSGTIITDLDRLAVQLNGLQEWRDEMVDEMADRKLDLGKRIDNIEKVSLSRLYKHMYELRGRVNSLEKDNRDDGKAIKTLMSRANEPVDPGYRKPYVKPEATEWAPEPEPPKEQKCLTCGGSGEHRTKAIKPDGECEMVFPCPDCDLRPMEPNKSESTTRTWCDKCNRWVYTIEDESGLSCQLCGTVVGDPVENEVDTDRLSKMCQKDWAPVRDDQDIAETTEPVCKSCGGTGGSHLDEHGITVMCPDCQDD